MKEVVKYISFDGKENEFCKTHNIDLTGKTKVKDFINLVKNSYGSEIIIELQKNYLENQ